MRKLSVERLASALVQITTDEKIQERARLLGERIRSENGVQTAIKYIYRDLEYSRAQVEKLGLKTGSRTSSTTNVPTSSAPLSTTSTSSLLPSSLFSRKKTTHLPLQPPLQSLILEIAPSS